MPGGELAAPAALTIADLPFVERPLRELLDLVIDRDGTNRDYAGFGWARGATVWLEAGDRPARRVDNALVIAVHAADDAEPLADDIELEFELPDRPVAVLASAFLERWLPRLPQGSAIVLAICNRHRAVLRRPVEASVPVHFALGDVLAWRDPEGANEVGGGIILSAEDWCILPSMTQTITEEQKQTYAGLYLLKKLDLKPADGGVELPVVLPSELSPLDETLQQLAVDDMIAINAKKKRYELTPQGVAYLGAAIDEAEALVDEFDDYEVEDAIAELQSRNLDVFRARFLWGWFEGEFDDLVMFQERRGVSPVERMWAFYLMSDEFWAELARELAGARALPPG
jgi:hypothetical protein